jgi:hypothetical protein
MSEECQLDINLLNQNIINAHNSYYVNGENTLIDKSLNASPNGNQIYHLYSNGKITHQKGAWAYLNRSEFQIVNEIPGARKIPFKFVNEGTNGITYAILTIKECIYYREQMEKYLKSLKSLNP